MLDRYRCESRDDYRTALKEILQEIALFGLWRNKFFEHAAFYEGTALRILYGLNRFSEDLDFTLLRPDSGFSLENYEKSMRRELEAFGFSLTVEVKKKNRQTAVQSAFIKGTTLFHLLKIGMEEGGKPGLHPGESIKIKFEVDTDPPLRFRTQAVPLFQPAPFSVKTYRLVDMFAGKLSAALFRQWRRRIKGRDWYDFLWFIGKQIPVNLDHFQARLEQIGAYSPEKKISLEEVKSLLHKKIEGLDIALAKADLLPFIKDPQTVDGWSKELFHAAAERLIAV